MMNLTELEQSVLQDLRDADEQGYDEWRNIYLDNCCFTKEERGALGSLEQKGLYQPASDGWGLVRFEAA